MKKTILLTTAILTSLIMSGCSTKVGFSGSNTISTNFVYPNSNVVPLGEVSAETSKTTWFLPPTLTYEDVVELREQALSQQAGATNIINPMVDTKFTVIPIPILNIFTMTTTIKGTAVKAEVGKQKLH